MGENLPHLANCVNHHFAKITKPALAGAPTLTGRVKSATLTSFRPASEKNGSAPFGRDATLQPYPGFRRPAGSSSRKDSKKRAAVSSGTVTPAGALIVTS